MKVDESLDVHVFSVPSSAKPKSAHRLCGDQGDDEHKERIGEEYYGFKAGRKALDCKERHDNENTRRDQGNDGGDVCQEGEGEPPHTLFTLDQTEVIFLPSFFNLFFSTNSSCLE